MSKPKACWYCGKGKMVPDALGGKCAKCGATWSPLPDKPGFNTVELTQRYGFVGMAGSPGPGAIYHPRDGADPV